MRFVLVVIIAVAAWPAGAGAAPRFEFQNPLNLFLDRSYIGFSPSRINVAGDPASPAGLIFEAQVAPNLFFPQLHFGDFYGARSETVISLVLTPLIRLRMLNEQSSPVIPPSFMPKMTLQFLHERRLKEEGEFHRAIQVGLHLILGHHSNGQSGCLFGNQTGKDPDCTPAAGQLPINEASGSFSTNYFRTELHARYIFKADSDFESGWMVDGAVALEANSKGGPGGIEEDQLHIYGKGHVGGEVSLQRLWSGHRARATITTSVPYGEAPSQRPTVSVEAAAMPAWAGGFGLFARHVSGQDYYNILFFERVNIWLIGIMFELGPGMNLPDNSSVLRN
jgi:hypothetical protein